VYAPRPMRKTIRVSDQTGKQIPDGSGATIRITFADARKGSREADVTDDEASAIADRIHARRVARRGRRPSSG
jgi:hypothetical protein